MIRLAVHGAAGKMGRRVCALAMSDDRFELLESFDRSATSSCSARGDESRAAEVEGIIDFSSDSGAQQAARIAARCNAALLVGTTGLSAQTLGILDDLARSTPVMIAPNTSRGVAVMNYLVAEAARLLGERYQIDLVEQHHRFKRDAPSGTALRLLETLAARAGIKVAPDRVHCIRAGDIIGEHEIQFAGQGERLRIAHCAGDRDLFAAGALDAMAWLHDRPPGSYRLEQALNLSDTPPAP